MFRNPFPHKEPYRPSEQEFNMLERYHLNLYQHCPRTKYGFLGVPCPSESILMQLELKRHKLRNTIRDCSKKDRLIQAEAERIKLAKQEHIDRLAIETRHKRKDSAACSDASRRLDTGSVTFMPGSAIYDTDDVKDEQEEGDDDDQYYTEEDDCEDCSGNEDHMSNSVTSVQSIIHRSITPSPGLASTISPGTLKRHTLPENFMYSQRAARHDLRDSLAKSPDLSWTLPQDSPIRYRTRRVPKNAPLRRSRKTKCLRDLVREEKDELEDLEKWKAEWRARWYRDQ